MAKRLPLIGEAPFKDKAAAPPSGVTALFSERERVAERLAHIARRMVHLRDAWASERCSNAFLLAIQSRSGSSTVIKWRWRRTSGSSSPAYFDPFAETHETDRLAWPPDVHDLVVRYECNRRYLNTAHQACRVTLRVFDAETRSMESLYDRGILIDCALSPASKNRLGEDTGAAAPR